MYLRYNNFKTQNVTTFSGSLPIIVKTFTMKLIIVKCLIFLCGYNTYCQTDSDLLGSFNWSQKVRLFHQDDKCGEWGGDKEIIEVYGEERGIKIRADYKKLIINCKDAIDSVVVKNIELNSKHKKLVEECIVELVQYKLNSAQIISHSGIYNSIVFSDSTFVMYHYPSNNWKKFHQLKKSILKK